MLAPPAGTQSDMVKLMQSLHPLLLPWDLCSCAASGDGVLHVLASSRSRVLMLPCVLTSRLPVRGTAQPLRLRGGGQEAYRQKVPVWPVVSTPAKKSAAISGNILRSLRRAPVLGSLARSSRSAKLPRAGCVALMWLSSPRTMFCSATHASAHRGLYPWTIRVLGAADVEAGACLAMSPRQSHTTP